MDTPPEFIVFKGNSVAEDLNGPFYYRKTDSDLRFGFRAQEKNCNGLGIVHGGVLTLFADYAATMAGVSGVKEYCTTISLNCNFLSVVNLHDWVEAQCVIQRRTRRMTFVHGIMQVGDEQALSFQAVLRRLPIQQRENSKA